MTTLDVRIRSQLVPQTHFPKPNTSRCTTAYTVFLHLLFDRYELIISVIYQCSYWLRISAQYQHSLHVYKMLFIELTEHHHLNKVRSYN